MDGSRLLGGKFPINLSRPLVRSTALRPLSPMTSCAEVSAWRTSELTITASSRFSMLPPYGEYGENCKGPDIRHRYGVCLLFQCLSSHLKSQRLICIGSLKNNMMVCQPAGTSNVYTGYSSPVRVNPMFLYNLRE